MTRALNESDREDVQDALETLEALGWVVTSYRADVERPVKVPQTKLELTAYKEP